jgi:hypothetical protein
MIFEKEITNKDYCREVLSSLSFFNFTSFELDILCVMLNNNIQVLNSDSREKIRKVLDKGKFTINNYIKRLRDKQVLLTINGTEHYKINPLVLNILKEGEVVYRFKINNGNVLQD